MSASSLPDAKKKPSALVYFLGFVFVLFISILVVTYMITRKTRPIYVDEHGNPTNAESSGQQPPSGKPAK